MDAVIQGYAYRVNHPFPLAGRSCVRQPPHGLCWSAETLYPEVYGCDLSACAKAFYNRFDHMTLADKTPVALLL